MKTQRQLLIPICLLLTTMFAADALAAGPKVDFNGDGSDDLAIGSPYETVSDSAGVKQYAGVVTVILGNNKGVQVLRYDQLIVGCPTSWPCLATRNDYFGYAVAPGDFNGDGYTDLAIGVPRVHTNPAMAGIVLVAYGSASGLKKRVSLRPCPLQPQAFRMYGAVEINDLYGFALAAGDFKLDGYADLAVGAPQRNNPSVGLADTGAVHILHGGGGASKLTATATVLKNAQPHSQSGYALAAGNFGKTGATDLAIGIPFYDNTATNSGGVRVYYGSLVGLSENTTSDGGGGTFWTTQVDNGFGPENYSDYFGWALTAGDFGTGSNSANTGFDDLAIGIPQREVGGYTDAGAVTVLYGGQAGLSNTGGLHLHLWYLGYTPTAYENFGQALSAGNFGYDNQEDLAIGIPRHPVAGLTASGAVSVVFGTSTGLVFANNKILHTGSSAQSNEFFGAALSSGQFGGDRYSDVVIGIPRWNVSTVGDAGSVSIRYGTSTGPASTTSDQWWTAPTPTQGAQFGFSLSK
jgi:hypothetical protein